MGNGNFQLAFQELLKTLLALPGQKHFWPFFGQNHFWPFFGQKIILALLWPKIIMSLIRILMGILRGKQMTYLILIRGNGKRLTPPSAFWSGSIKQQMASRFLTGILMGNLIGILPGKQMAYLI